MQSCSTCGQAKPLAEFGRDGRRRNGRSGRCRSCVREYRKRWMAAHPGYQREQYQRHREKRLAQQKAKREGSLEDARRRARERYHANPEPQRRRSQKRNRTPEARTQTREWHKANPERVRELSRKSEAKRRAQKYTTAVSDIDPVAIFKRDDGICGICGGPVEPGHWHLDHIVPLARGGSHLHENVQVAHPRCNLAKGARITRMEHT